MSGRRPRILIAHADGESTRAAELADALGSAGYDVVHQGTLLVGESLVEEASRMLVHGHPVVVCGTVQAVGTGWVHRIVHAARHHEHCLVLPVRMDRSAYLEMLDWGASVAEYWQDPALALTRLCETLAGLPQRDPQLTSTKLEDDDHRTRRAAASALGRTDQRSTLADRLLAMVHSSDPETRAIGVVALPIDRRPELCDPRRGAPR